MFGKHNWAGVIKAAAFALAGALFSQPASASLMDWHVTPGGTSFSFGTYANWMPYGGTNPNNPNSQSSGIANGISYSIWDGYGPHGNATTGSAHNDNDFGGQEFDAKAMYGRVSGDTLYVGVITGFNPAGVADPYGRNVTYTAGDLAINPNWSHSTATYGVIVPQHSAPDTGLTTLVSGGTWTVPQQAEGFAGPPDVCYAGGGKTVDSGISFDYTDLGIDYQDSVTKGYVDTYLLEFAIPLSDLPNVGGDAEFSWGASCGNDVMTLSVPVGSVPEPTGLLGLGGLGMLLMRRRKSSRALQQ